MAPEIKRRRSNTFILQNRRMKMKKKGKPALGARLTALCMAALMAVSLVPVQTAEAAGETFTKVTSADELTDGRYIMVTDTGYAPGVLDGTWISAEQVIADEGNGIQLGNTIQENADTVWEVSVTSADGAEDLTVTLKDKNGTFIAPKGGNNNGVSEGEYNWKVVFDQENQKFTFSGQGDDTVVLASNKGSQNKFRAYKTTTVSGNPNAYPSEFTLYKADDGGSSSVTVAAPQATPQAGEVESGTVVALTTSTAGAQIYFTLDGSDPADANNETRQLYSEDDQPVITEDCTLRAAAVLEGVYSAVQELKYTVAESGQDEPVLKDGDQVVIYAPAYNKALSAEYTGYYNKGTDVTVSEDGTLSGYTDMDVWTVTDNGDGTYSFSHDGQNIGMGDSLFQHAAGREK